MSQHIRFWIHFVRVAFTSTKDTASSYIFKRSFVSMPIHLLVLFLLFIMSNLFYRGGGAGSILSILKEAKKNYMGRFIFTGGGGGGGGLFAYSYAKKKKKIHNTSVATFNILAITISLIYI